MVLNERKIKILEAIINDYILTAEPIGSRTIAKKYNLGISSATVRNEMSDLEDMGLIVQPHASAGRVPSDKGYRYFVDSMGDVQNLSDEEAGYLCRLIADNINQVDACMREVARAIALLTHYTTIVSEPQFKLTRVKHIQLVPIDDRSMVLMLVTDSKAIKNSIIHLYDCPDHQKLSDLSALLNSLLGGHSFSEIKNTLAGSVLAEFKADSDILRPVIGALLDMIKSEDDIQVYTGGVKNILAFPEFSNVEKAKGIFTALEEKDLLVTLLDSEDPDKVQVVIGSENNMEQMKDCSIIKASYKLGNENAGSIGIIGPTRMDYKQVVSTLGAIVKNLSDILASLSGG